MICSVCRLIQGRYHSPFHSDRQTDSGPHQGQASNCQIPKSPVSSINLAALQSPQPVRLRYQYSVIRLRSLCSLYRRNPKLIPLQAWSRLKPLVKHLRFISSNLPTRRHLAYLHQSNNLSNLSNLFNLLSPFSPFNLLQVRMTNGTLLPRYLRRPRRH